MTNEIDREYLGQLLLAQGFEYWARYIFRVIEQRKFEKEEIHKDIFKCFELIETGKEKRLNLNIPPRAGKTLLSQLFVVYCLTKNPRSNIIYTSYSQSLLADIAQKIAQILEHPIYKALYPRTQQTKIENEEISPIDEFWAEYLKSETGKNQYSAKKIITKQGGVCLFSAIGGQITGYGAGIRGAKDLAGFLLCFPYYERVWTNKGKLKIGDIVENKLDIEVYSYNQKTKKVELKPIKNYIKTNGEEVVRVTLQDGTVFHCTKNHKVWTKNRGYIEAEELIGGIDIVKTLSNSLDLHKREISFFYNITSFIISISNELQKLIIKFYLFSRFIVNFTRKILKRFFSFNSLYRTYMAIKSLGNFSKCSFIFCYINYILTGKFTSRENQSTDFNGVLHIIALSAVSKIFKTIIRGVRIKMSDFNPLFLNANESPHNKLMNTETPSFVVFSKINNLVAFTITRVQKFFFANKRASILTASCKHNPRTTDNITKVRNPIKTLITRDVLINDVCFVNHCDNSYCLTVYDNHNLFVGENQGVLVSNCDDGNKPADIHSETMRKKVTTYFKETLLSRLNDSNTPILNIQQRLHLEDLSGFLADKYKFKTIKKPLVDENNNCLLPKQYTPERIKELQIDNYLFSSQYQQEPIILGGEVIKRSWFNYYDINFKYVYKKIVIASDTAMSTKESADRSCFLVGGVTQNNQLHIIDFICGRWDYPTLKQKVIELWNKWQLDKRSTSASALYVEEKASGIQILQELKKTGIPILPLKADKDKYTRVQGVLEYIASGQVFLPHNEQYGFNPEILNEVESFTRDNSHLHDDITDTLVYLINVTIARKQVSLLEVL